MRWLLERSITVPITLLSLFLLLFTVCYFVLPFLWYGALSLQGGDGWKVVTILVLLSVPVLFFVTVCYFVLLFVTRYCYCR